MSSSVAQPKPSATNTSAGAKASPSKAPARSTNEAKNEAKSNQEKSKHYHHGDLRRALLDAAHTLAYEGGVDGLTLREVARRAGVSPAAPYHHFADKNDLLRVLASQAFETLTLQLTAAAQLADDPVQRLEELGVAYVRFAFAHLPEFRFMFRADLCLPPELHDGLEESGQAAQQVLLDHVIAAQASGHLRSGQPESDAQMLTLTLWSAVHGLSSILLESPLSKTSTPKQGQQLARSVVKNVLRGILAENG